GSYTYNIHVNRMSNNLYPVIIIRYTELLVPFFFFNATAPTEIYTLSLHDALPISIDTSRLLGAVFSTPTWMGPSGSSKIPHRKKDRKSTRLNSSHVKISYAVFCLKKKTKHADPRSK